MATPRHEAYTADVRQNTKRFWEAYLFILAAQNEWNAQDYLNTMDIDETEVTPAQLGSVVFDTVNAVKAVMDAGSATNITNILPAE